MGTTNKRTVEMALGTPGVDAQGRPIRTPVTVTEEGTLAQLQTGSPVTFETVQLAEPDLAGEHMLINIGPQHPATHGVLRLVLELDGETVVRCIPHVGYLHCGFEKIGEYRQYNQIIPWTDREDYLNSMGNNVAFALGAERLFGVEITPRCTVLRVIASELSRIISHLVWLGTTCIDIGAFTPFLWAFDERENVYRLFDAWVGARLTTSATRVGGMAADIPDGWMDGLRAFLSTFPRTIDEIDRMLTTNAIWVGRTVGLGAMSPDEATNYGLSGPLLRASGVAYDVRKDFPYLEYETYEFDVPVGTHGDVYDRYLVRMEELRQSVRILQQAADRLPDGPVNCSDHRVILPPKSDAMSDMESMIHHFKQVMEGPRPPIGECYVAVESPKGEKGYYFVSDGTAKPVRWRIRPPSFVNLSAIPKMVEGTLLSDVIAINASIDIVMGEIDR
ncbi:MAG TPA: NADH dehydrogenase (quinone) subunit D [Gemmatimonadaceae bacterium]|nr:NADH dehydrogenase (quinone) subunit D [Gemmatimonadaceae bacterium]